MWGVGALGAPSEVMRGVSTLRAAAQSDAIVTLECESKSQGKYGNLKASVIFLVQDHLFVLPSFSSLAALLCSSRAMQGPLLLEGHCCCAESSTSEWLDERPGMSG